MPRCFAYHALSALGSRARRKMPPMPVTRAISGLLKLGMSIQTNLFPFDEGQNIVLAAPLMWKRLCTITREAHMVACFPRGLVFAKCEYDRRAKRSGAVADAGADLCGRGRVPDDVVFCDGDYSGTDRRLAVVGRAGCV